MRVAGDDDRDLLGVALLALHGALEDYFRERLATHPHVPATDAAAVTDVGQCSWKRLLRLAGEHAGLRHDEQSRIRTANSYRQGFAHGSELWCLPRFVANYAEFVERFISQERLGANLLKDGTAGDRELLAGQLELYTWEQDLIASLEEAGWRRVIAYDLPPRRVRLADPAVVVA